MYLCTLYIPEISVMFEHIEARFYQVVLTRAIVGDNHSKLTTFVDSSIIIAHV